jgi:Pyruvate/2-oxoacid:ferredoxin oxidoreductase delta subunit
MIAAAPAIPRILLYEGDGSTPFDAPARLALVTLLLEKGFTIGRVVAGASLPDLGHRELIILGKFGGTIPAKLSSPADEVELHARDVTDLTATEVLEQVQALSQQTGTATASASGWKPWFPVIDFDRCTNCMQCLSFCLFDVYGVTANDKITVQNESNCKTDCPACSRVCPEVAILFPKYKAGPINGDVVSDDDVRREAMKVDISALLGGDIYSMLKDRSAKAKSRFSKERDDDRALKERQRCLNKLKEMPDLDIPAEVLSSLPSMDQIQQKAREAKRRAQAALDRNAGQPTP